MLETLKPDDTYTCSLCGGEFTFGRSNEEAWAEYDKNFPGEDHEDAKVICENCYQLMLAVCPPEKLDSILASERPN